MKNIDILNLVKDVDDNEIKYFVSSEKNRLGNEFQCFTITWYEIESEYQLVLCSHSKREYQLELNRKAAENNTWPYGIEFTIGRITKFENDSLDKIRCAGRAFYYLWRKEIDNLKRELSIYNS